jgi:hypothetical protein
MTPATTPPDPLAASTTPHHTTINDLPEHAHQTLPDHVQTARPTTPCTTARAASGRRGLERRRFAPGDASKISVTLCNQSWSG